MRAVRFEYLLGTACAVLWAFAIVLQTRYVSAAGLLDLNLYTLYGIAATLGWLAGNVYVARQRRLRGGRWRLAALYASGPVSVILLLRSFAPVANQLAAPLVPLYGFVVYWIFFLVPVSFRRTG